MRHVLYMHGGSGNHGCEAIVRSTCALLGERATLYSNAPAEDRRYGVDEACDIRPHGRALARGSARHAAYKLRKALTGSAAHYLRHEFRDLIEERDAVCYSVGGDNYCDPSYPAKLAFVNRALGGNRCRTVLLGCSIEPALLAQPAVAADLRRYDLIVARETMTCDALRAAGIDGNLWQCPDPAFLLQATESALPAGFEDGQTVGVNVSPLVMRREPRPGLVRENYRRLIQHVLDETDLNVALIPHVVWPGNDDREPLRELHAAFRHRERVAMVEDAGCRQLKGLIARCRFFVGARTHATIAAYSSGVPTLVVGYSVKAKGLAQDLFGDHARYVVPVQELSRADDLAAALDWLRAHEAETREELRTRIPRYQQTIRDTGRRLSALFGTPS